ncbi:MAG TPA: AbrB family transcriptional regulator [Roseiarcus sp.]|nr:AbrB family transcriptional regulator [Roseiarcus sp.]
MPRFTLRKKPPDLQWGALLGATVIGVAAFEAARLPAALLLGATGAAILLAWFEARVKIPPLAFVIAQGFVGCLVARAITPAIVMTILSEWPMFLFLIAAVIAFATSLGFILARWKILPGTTAVWGSSPGGATAMVLMADAYGGDIRLVAVMQYLRVACVGLTASIVARAWTASGGAAPEAIPWFPPLEPVSFLATLALGVGGGILGLKLRIPAGALLVPLFVGAPLAATHLITITLPPWLLATAYALVGWSIGFRFTREMVVYASRQLPRILASIFTLIAMCGGLAFALHEAAGTDALTAYLATSPGGADAVAIIAASSPVDVPFVMAMQVGRLLIVILIGPALARMIARLTGGAEPASKAQRCE